MVMATFYPGPAGLGDAVVISPDVPVALRSLSPATTAVPPQYPASAQFCATPGAYLIVADDSMLQNNALPSPNLPSCNGYTYQIGNPMSGYTGAWYLAPGNDMKNSRYQPVKAGAGQGYASGTGGAITFTPSPPPNPPTAASGNWVRCYIVGRGYANPASATPDTTISGAAMDIAIFSTVVKVK
jgi:hypothetical protein